jgi:trehalose-phosphatase
MPRLKPLWLHLEAIAERIAAAPLLAVGCDFDGTLTDIVPHPNMVQVSERTRAALLRLAKAEETTVGILSGRGLDDLIKHLQVPGAFYAGCNGLEIQESGGERDISVTQEQTLSDDFVKALDRWCRRFPGAWLEKKNVSVALHCRAVPERRRLSFAAGVLRRVRAEEGRVTVIRGKMVFEVLPAVARDKSYALEQWLKKTPNDTAVVYIGDDTNDEPVFHRVRSWGDVTIAVGRERSAAEFVAETPRDVVWFIEWLAREWRWRGHDGAGSNGGSTTATAEPSAEPERTKSAR